jgi:hypothetical protein
MNKLLVKKILERATEYDWSLQGFGMLRLYLEPEVRLHVWDHQFRIADVSDIHTHPWNFESTIVAGMLFNTQYYECTYGEAFYQGRIVTGEAAEVLEEPRVVRLSPFGRETYANGARYYQHMRVPHVTIAERGTVTIIARDSRQAASEAFSYWPAFRGRDGWVSAAPRTATADEVRRICDNSLQRWF